MPFLRLSTNVTIDQTQAEQLLSELLQLLAKETGKPERYVMFSCHIPVSSNLFDELDKIECKYLDH